jgi:hypothetical protein
MYLDYLGLYLIHLDLVLMLYLVYLDLVLVLVLYLDYLG